MSRFKEYVAAYHTRCQSTNLPSRSCKVLSLVVVVAVVGVREYLLIGGGCWWRQGVAESCMVVTGGYMVFASSLEHFYTFNS